MGIRNAEFGMRNDLSAASGTHNQFIIPHSSFRISTKNPSQCFSGTDESSAVPPKLTAQCRPLCAAPVSAAALYRERPGHPDVLQAASLRGDLHRRLPAGLTPCPGSLQASYLHRPFQRERYPIIIHLFRGISRVCSVFSCKKQAICSLTAAGYLPCGRPLPSPPATGWPAPRPRAPCAAGTRTCGSGRYRRRWSAAGRR